MNKYEQHLEKRRVLRGSYRLQVGMRVYLKSGIRYNILRESGGHFWGSDGIYASPIHPGWYWTGEGEFYGLSGRAPTHDIDWDRTEVHI